jgi:hypothetical protein
MLLHIAPMYTVVIEYYATNKISFAGQISHHGETWGD